MEPIKVSIICMAYNQAPFIRSALDGFLIQKTNFPFEVLIHDDASTDGTADIIREYAEKYPHIIKPVLQTENQWSRGTHILVEHVWPKIRGKYVAVCDGDDYWTDPNKLQKQVDFLDAHPDYSICFHPISVFWNDNSTPDQIWGDKNFSFDTLLHRNFIPNCSVMYRWNKNVLETTKKLPWHIYPGDWFTHLLVAKNGKIGWIPGVMARYRRHAAGVSFVSEEGPQSVHLSYGVNELHFFLSVEKYVAPNPEKYHVFVCNVAREIAETYLKNQNFDAAKQVCQLCPDLFNYETTDFMKYKKYKQLFNSTLFVAIAELLLIIVCIIINIVR